MGNIDQNGAKLNGCKKQVIYRNPAYCAQIGCQVLCGKPDHCDRVFDPLGCLTTSYILVFHELRSSQIPSRVFVLLRGF